jgi:hypothetical protein
MTQLGLSSSLSVTRRSPSRPFRLTMEKLRSYISPRSRLRPQYSVLTQSANDELDFCCPHCGHTQNDATQALVTSVAPAWLALWTIAVVLFGVFVVSVLLLTKQFKINYLSTSNNLSTDNPSLLSDQAFSDSKCTSCRRERVRPRLTGSQSLCVE